MPFKFYKLILYYIQELWYSTAKWPCLYLIHLILEYCWLSSSRFEKSCPCRLLGMSRCWFDNPSTQRLTAPPSLASYPGTAGRKRAWAAMSCWVLFNPWWAQSWRGGGSQGRVWQLPSRLRALYIHQAKLFNNLLGSGETGSSYCCMMLNRANKILRLAIIVGYFEQTTNTALRNCCDIYHKHWKKLFG